MIYCNFEIQYTFTISIKTPVSKFFLDELVTILSSNKTFYANKLISEMLKFELKLQV